MAEEGGEDQFYQKCWKDFECCDDGSWEGDDKVVGGEDDQRENGVDGACLRCYWSGRSGKKGLGYEPTRPKPMKVRTSSWNRTVGGRERPAILDACHQRMVKRAAA